MKIKFLIITTFTILFLYVLRLPVLADSVSDWSGLQARFTVGDLAITISQDIINNSGGTVLLMLLPFLLF